MTTAPGVLVGKSTVAQRLLLSHANRHGLIAGATGTGKTVTLQILAEGFSACGVPVFMADVKGDLSGISQPGSRDHKLHDKLLARARTVGLADYAYRGFPTVFWDLYGEQGHPVRTTISDMGPLMLARLLELNETQEGVLNIAFRVADDNGLLLLDLKDLRAPRQPGLRRARGDHRTGCGRGAGLDAGRQGRAVRGGTHPDPPPGLAPGPGGRGRACGSHRGGPARRPL